ncbi:MAG TPA: hypothetical protein DD640_01465 [Clostridiales bacterium]|nr:hypothetical protein [Clostridiales bacterium]
MTLRNQEIPARICTRQDLENDFQEIGIRAGMTLVVHSSLKSLGWVPGGARSVVDALLAVLGLDGTLVMPAHCGDNSDPAYWRHPPVPEDWWSVIRSETPPFDPALSPCSGMGAVADCFRAYPGVLRSNHPTSSFIARGPQAAELLARHDLDCCLGENSPCGALERANAWVLLLGVDFDRCTVMHLAEYRSQCRTSIRQASAICKDGRREFAPYTELEFDSDDFPAPGREMEASGLVRRLVVSGSQLRLFRVRDAVKTAESWLGRNRLRRLGEPDRLRILDYLRQEPEYNLFLIGDIENFGMAPDFMDVMAYEKDGAIDSVLLRYHHSFIPYSHKPDFDTAPLLSALRTPNLRILSGKQSVIDRLRPHLPGFKWRNSFLMKLSRADLKDSAAEDPPPPQDVVIRRTAAGDVPALADFIAGIAEFSRQGSRAEQVAELQAVVDSGSNHYFIAEHQGQIIADAGTTAENSLSAMVVAVATRPDWRNRGLASRLVSALAADRLSGGREYLCLFYDNPAAGKIYRRLGFQDAGQWAMAVPESPIPVKEE